MDQIILTDLEVFYCIGVPDEERAKPQRLLLTIEMAHDFSNAVATDDVRQTINYDAVARRLRALGEGRSWKLLEKLAADIAAIVLGEFGAQSVTVTAKKFIFPDARWVGVQIVRS